MSKKFLSEAQVRRYQGLAGIPPVNEMGGGYYGDRDEDELPGDEGPGEELPPGKIARTPKPVFDPVPPPRFGVTNSN